MKFREVIRQIAYLVYSRVWSWWRRKSRSVPLASIINCNVLSVGGCFSSSLNFSKGKIKTSRIFEHCSKISVIISHWQSSGMWDASFVKIIISWRSRFHFPLLRESFLVTLSTCSNCHIMINGKPAIITSHRITSVHCMKVDILLYWHLIKSSSN